LCAPLVSHNSTNFSKKTGVTSSLFMSGQESDPVALVLKFTLWSFSLVRVSFKSSRFQASSSVLQGITAE
jgi:hypothetical protein